MSNYEQLKRRWNRQIQKARNKKMQKIQKAKNKKMQKIFCNQAKKLEKQFVEKANIQNILEIREKERMNRYRKRRDKYPIDWVDDLKESIKKRDKYICQICEIHQDEVDKNFAIHHIDYNKFNLNPNNLITLCNSCHSKTNYNRSYWIRYFHKGSSH